MVKNFNFGVYYEKIFKKEYLPTRIRYNQFFFYAGLIGGYFWLKSQNKRGCDFCVSNPADPELAHREYFSSDRAVVNVVMR